ncbi:MAG: putative sugar kinase [Candidatus Saganbacteria bacterium]|uniref:NAD kinase n=1 Tax=Candidatus Saganbacteria bacterium TaxID=2575572 RepID=A0A833L1V0_UNCSA|nr:MAG: putative sugar kinase [Candidatus Saganbacteria bacterium]
MKIGIIYKEEDAIVAGTAKKVMAELAAAGHKAINITKNHALKGIDFIITFGGDGTILRAARITAKNKIPLLTAHLGGLGILSEISHLEIIGSVELVKSKKYHLDSRMMLDAGVIRNGKKIKSTPALNDIVIGKSSIARTIKLEAFLKDKSIASYIGDGLIISTATGSTAYNFAVNGPILPPDSKSFILSPICPHRGANRSIILEDSINIKIVKGEDLLLTADGQETFYLKKGDVITIGKSEYKTNFIRLKEYNIWELLKNKLGWI